MKLPVEEETIVCPHFEYTTETNMHRVTDEKTGELSFMLEVQVNCALCGAPFRFLGLGEKLDYTKPFVQQGGLMMIAPMRTIVDPAGDPSLS